MADERTPNNGNPNSSDEKQSSGLGGGFGDLVKAESMIQLAIALPAGCLIGWLIGSWADRHFHQSWFGILGIILGEACAIAIAGGAIGYALSTVLTSGVSKSPAGQFMPPIPAFSPVVATACIVTALVVGFASSLVPAMGASRISIVQALRSTD